MNCFDQALDQPLTSAAPATLQLNLGPRCNLSCRHCHIQGSPIRTERMDDETMSAVLRFAATLPPAQIDLTGGAPELHPRFRSFVDELLGLGHQVQVRTNFTVFFQPGMEDLPTWYARRGIALVGSLPCYLEQNVKAQRGERVFEQSLAAIGELNALGYGRSESLSLSLVYNPGGAFLPPPQQNLEEAYRAQLKDRFALDFTRLYAITNMPIGRFWDDLVRQGKSGQYRALLHESFNPRTVPGLMCRHQISIGWDGTLYDCDFNLALKLPAKAGSARNIRQLKAESLEGREIVTGLHCFGCTAGAGSSCGGTLAA